MVLRDSNCSAFGRQTQDTSTPVGYDVEPHRGDVEIWSDEASRKFLCKISAQSFAILLLPLPSPSTPVTSPLAEEF